MAKEKQEETVGPAETKIAVMAKRLRELKDRKDELDVELTEINKEVVGWFDKKTDTYHKGLEELLGEYMLETEISSVKIKGIGCVYTVEDVKPKVEDDELMKTWLRKNDLEAIIKETVHWQTLRSLCNELAEQFKPLPEGVKMNERTVARIRRS